MNREILSSLDMIACCCWKFKCDRGRIQSWYLASDSEYITDCLSWDQTITWTPRPQPNCPDIPEKLISAPYGDMEKQATPGRAWWGNNVVGVPLGPTRSHRVSLVLTDKQSFRSLDRPTDLPSGQTVHLDWWIKIITIETVPTTNYQHVADIAVRFTFSFAEHYKLETGKKMNQIFCNLPNLHELWTDVIVLLNKNTISDLSNFDQQNHLLGLIHRDYGGD